MRSTTPFRLQQCRGVLSGEAPQRFWAMPKFRVGGPLPGRRALQASKEALKRLITVSVAGAPTPLPPAASGEVN